MKKIGEVEICGMRYDIKTDAHPVVGDDECYGYLDVDTHSIVIQEDLTPDRFENTLVHEVMHACFDASGLGAALTAVLKRGAKREDVEEQIVRGLTSTLIGSLRSIGMMRKKRWTGK